MVSERKRNNPLKLLPEAGRRDQPRTRKRNKGDDTIDCKNGNQITLFFSPGLKEKLTKDRDLITLKNNFVKIPAKYTCEMIFKEFLLNEKQENSVYLNNGVTLDMISGLRTYFNHRFTVEILYKEELPQVKNLAGKTVFTEIYGSEHLLRLLSCIGKLISPHEFDDHGFIILQNHFQRLLDFIDINKEKYLSVDNYFQVVQ